jgi:type VI secretion system protein ImpM
MREPVTPPAPPDNGQTPGGPGFFGKLPSHGDYVTRRLPSALRSGWEAWLDAGLERSREMLGDKWLELYLSSPIWCFAAAAGCCGEKPFAGVLMPSVDRIGRYFPLSVLTPVETECSAAEIALGAKGWFERVSAIALSCLADDFDLARFDGALAAEPFPSLDDSAAGSLEGRSVEDDPIADVAPLLGRLLERSGMPYSLWWTSGSPAIAACCRAFQSLPRPEDFAKLLG